MRTCFLANCNTNYGTYAPRLIIGRGNFGISNRAISSIVFAAQSRFSETNILSRKGGAYSTGLNKTCAARSYSCPITSHYSIETQRRTPMAASRFHSISIDLLVNIGRSRRAFVLVKPIGVSFTRIANFHKAGFRVSNLAINPHLSNLLGSSLRISSTISSRCYYNGAAPDDAPLTDDQIEVTANLTSEKSSDQTTLMLISGSFYLPHPAKVKTGGEDGHFICEEERVIGVADGVGGWADVGIDAGKYARELMSNSVSSIKNGSKESIDPLKVLEKAYEATNAQGSSTACIIALTNEGIRAINVGDSGFIVIRDGSTVFQSPPQQYEFNFPYQLGNAPGSDIPSSGQVFEFPVKEGDVIVAGTDGLFDNLYNSEISAIVVEARRVHLDPEVTAQKIASHAQETALDRSKETPFAASAKGAGYLFHGGKLDDITVVVSYVTDTYGESAE